MNRILIIAIAAAGAILAACVFLVAVGAVSTEQLGALGWLPNQFDWERRATLTAMIAALAFLIATALFVAEVRAGGHRGRHLLVIDDQFGRVVVALRGVEELVRQEAGRVGGVRDVVRSRVGETKEGLRVEQRVSVAPDANVADLSRELQQRTKSAVERFIGRPVSEVHVDAHLTTPPRLATR